MNGTRTFDAIRSASEELETSLSAIGGCGDGNCIVLQPKGQHTNGGCRCSRDFLKMQRFAYAHNRFAASVKAAAEGFRP